MAFKLNFSANLSTMFGEFPFLERFKAAERCGFQNIEIQNPYEFEPNIIKEQLGSLKCNLVNIYCESNFGCASIPMHEDEFWRATQKVMPYYDALNFKKLHVLSGEMSKFTNDDHHITLVQRLESLVASDYLENRNLTAVIEPICADVSENYFLNSFETAVEIIKQVNSDQIKLLLDIYHLHKITGDVPKYLEMYYPYAGHIQISQDPGRTEPFCEGGQIDYKFVLDFLQQKKHSDPIGLEYYPSGSTEDSLAWMKNYSE